MLCLVIFCCGLLFSLHVKVRVLQTPLTTHDLADGSAFTTFHSALVIILPWGIKETYHFEALDKTKLSDILEGPTWSNLRILHGNPKNHEREIDFGEVTILKYYLWRLSRLPIWIEPRGAFTPLEIKVQNYHFPSRMCHDFVQDSLWFLTGSHDGLLRERFVLTGENFVSQDQSFPNVREKIHQWEFNISLLGSRLKKEDKWLIWTNDSRHIGISKPKLQCCINDLVCIDM